MSGGARRREGPVGTAVRIALRVAMTAVQLPRRALEALGRGRDRGVHAVPVTPRGTIVLVRLRYARGWRLPGGGRGDAEDPREAALRELEEEIGMYAHGAVESVHRSAGSESGAGEASLFVVRDVEYRPRWSLEIEAVTEVPPDRLPSDVAEPARRALALARPMLTGE